MAALESRLSLRQLRYFVSVVEQRSFTAAAAELHVAQPSLSRQVAQLEEALGMQLLIRTPSGVLATPAGSIAYHDARQMLDRVNGLADKLRGTSQQPQGRVAVALPATSGSDFIAEVVKSCQQAFPQVELQVLDGLSHFTAQRLETGRVDFGVLPNADEVQGIVSEPILREYLYLVQSAQGTRRGATEIDFARLAQVPLVLPPRTLHLRRFLERAALEQGVSLDVRYEQQSVSTITGFVTAGLAATVSNWPSAVNILPAGTFVTQRIVKPELTRLVSIAHPAERPLSQAAHAAYTIVRRLLLERVADGRWRGEAVGGPA